MNKDKRSAVRTAFVPTPAERNGDFSGAPLAGCTPAAPDRSRSPASPSRATASRPTASARRARRSCSSTPLPNTTPTAGCNNWVEAVTTPVNWRQENARSTRASATARG